MSFELNISTLPNYILYLEGVQLSYIKVYVHIFNLWHSQKPCYLSNREFCNRTGLNKDTVSNAITFFEKHGILKRKQKGTRRYLIQPEKVLETTSESVDNLKNSCSKNDNPPELDRQPAGVRPSDPPELDRHNNKYNNKYNKSSCSSNDKKQSNEKKPDWANQAKSSGFANVESQSTSYDPLRKGAAEKASIYVEEYMNKKTSHI